MNKSQNAQKQVPYQQYSAETHGENQLQSKKCLKQSPENWVVLEGMNEPIIDQESFQKVQVLVNNQKYTQSQTH